MSTEHKHIYDAHGKQICCSPHEAKINEKADEKLVQQEGAVAVEPSKLRCRITAALTGSVLSRKAVSESR